MYIVIIRMLIGANWVQIVKKQAEPHDILGDLALYARGSMLNGESIEITLSPKVA